MLNRNNVVAHQPSKLVAVVVPLSDRKEFSPDEKISLRHLTHFLGNYDKYLVAPKSLKINYPGVGIRRFDDRFFGNVKAHRNLMFSPEFYKSFIDYKYILIYHLDALVFSDQLTEWCEMDFDFIGAPWIRHEDAPYAGNSAYEDKVGNGGFCLKKISSFLKVIYSPRYSIEPAKYWENCYALKSKYIQFLNLPKRFLKYSKFFNNARWEMSRWGYISDERFWANRATHYYPRFKIAPVETALRFAFECVPRFCFELNNRVLPFGCHAWHKYDRNFWEPYLLK